MNEDKKQKFEVYLLDVLLLLLTMVFVLTFFIGIVGIILCLGDVF